MHAKQSRANKTDETWPRAANSMTWFVLIKKHHTHAPQQKKSIEMHCIKQSLWFLFSDYLHSLASYLQESLPCYRHNTTPTTQHPQHNTHNTQLISLIRSRDLITHLLLWVALCSFALVLFFLLILLVCFSLSCDSVSGRSHYAEARIVLILRHHSSLQPPRCQLTLTVR